MSLVLNLSSSEKVKNLSSNLNSGQLVSILYHDIFDYPLDSAEIFKWQAGKLTKRFSKKLKVATKQGFLFEKGRENLVSKRLIRKKISGDKFEEARKVGMILNFLPLVKMVAVTGALAMENASEKSDIDLMVITKRGTLWTTRGIVWLLLKLFRFPLRVPKDRKEKDKLCLNIWLDETDLVWPENERNIFTAHEMAQIVPLVNKNDTYEKFISQNSWIRDYWPNAVEIRNQKHGTGDREKLLLSSLLSLISSVVEKICYKMQYLYMKPKITRETITPTRALFHPVDWERIIFSQLN